MSHDYLSVRCGVFLVTVAVTLETMKRKGRGETITSTDYSIMVMMMGVDGWSSCGFDSMVLKGGGKSKGGWVSWRGREKSWWMMMSMFQQHLDHLWCLHSLSYSQLFLHRQLFLLFPSFDNFIAVFTLPFTFITLNGQKGKMMMRGTWG